MPTIEEPNSETIDDETDNLDGGGGGRAKPTLTKDSLMSKVRVSLSPSHNYLLTKFSISDQLFLSLGD